MHPADSARPIPHAIPFISATGGPLVKRHTCSALAARARARCRTLAQMGGRLSLAMAITPPYGTREYKGLPNQRALSQVECVYGLVGPLRWPRCSCGYCGRSRFIVVSGVSFTLVPVRSGSSLWAFTCLGLYVVGSLFPFVVSAVRRAVTCDLWTRMIQDEW